MRRIDSARLLAEIPDVDAKLESGALNLSQLSRAQRAFRTVKKLERRPVSTDKKRDILSKLQFSDSRKTEILLCQELNISPPPPVEKETFHRDESVSVTVHFQKTEMELLERVQNLVAHAVPDAEWSKLFVYLAKKELHRRLGAPKLVRNLAMEESKQQSMVGG